MTRAIRLLLGDVLSFARHYRGPLYHAMLTDPPYHLTSIVKRFSNETKAQPNEPFRRHTTGFMGKHWDGGDIAFRPETWAALGALLHPGAFVMAFAGTRGYHRMACAIEDVGFIVHPAIGWVFGSGFPKATRIDTQIDAAAGVHREKEIIPTKPGNLPEMEGDISLGANGFTDVSQPVTELAREWSGHRYGLQALKPAFEFICVAQKPYAGRAVDSIVVTGSGALNIDGGRIKTADDLSHPPSKSNGWKNSSALTGSVTDDWRKGRWPANFALTHHPDCKQTFETIAAYECVDGCPVKMMDGQSGELTSGDLLLHHKLTGGKVPIGTFEIRDRTGEKEFIGNSGTASRFFHNSDWSIEVAERIAAADPMRYEAKASRGERDNGLEDKNIHPTQKPLALTAWLATLLLPPSAYTPRRLLVPFAGAASEMIGGYRAGWETITGIELERDYVALGRERLDYWLAQGVQESLL